MEKYVTREEFGSFRRLLNRAEIQAHIATNFAFTALSFCDRTAEVLDSLEKSYEAGLTELTYSQATDEDIELYKELYRSYINQLRLLSR